MKKTILAPAVALAFTGLVASPVAAAEAPSAQSSQSEQSDSKTNDEKKAEAAAEKAEKEKAEQEKAEQEAEAKAKKEAAAERKAAEEAAKKKAAEEKKSEDEADGGEADPKPTPKPKDNADDNGSDDKDAKEAPKDAAKKPNASVSVAASISAEDLAADGLKVNVGNLEKGDKVSVTGEDLTAKSVTAADSSAALTLQTPKSADDIEAGAQSLTVQVTRTGEADNTTTQKLTESVTILAAEGEPELTLGTDEISESDFEKNGVEFSGTGFAPNSTVTVSAGPAQSVFYYEDVETNENGEFTTTIKSENPLAPGEYEVRAQGPEETVKTTLTISEDEDAVDPIDATLEVEPDEITAEDLANKDKGVTVTVTGVQKGDKITDSLTGKTETAEADGDYKLHLYYKGDPNDLEEGDLPFTVTIDREGTESKTLNGTINVVDDEAEAPAEASFTVSPKTIEAPDFADDEKGVTLAVENCEPGADVHFEVNPKGINVTAYENTVTADDEGRASVNVYGTSSNASAYVGSYTATATCGDDIMKDSFKVTEGANAGGDNGDDSDSGNAGDNGNDGSQLPRTGADLGGLATGALLLLVGGAAIALTGRKNKAGQTPTSL